MVDVTRARVSVWPFPRVVDGSPREVNGPPSRLIWMSPFVPLYELNDSSHVCVTSSAASQEASTSSARMIKPARGIDRYLFDKLWGAPRPRESAVLDKAPD